MSTVDHKQRISFRATKIVSKPVKVEFRNSAGQIVKFAAPKDMPKVVQVNFLSKKK